MKILVGLALALAAVVAIAEEIAKEQLNTRKEAENAYLQGVMKARPSYRAN